MRHLTPDEKSARSIYERRIENLVSSLLPNGAGTMSKSQLRTALSQVAQVAFSSGEDHAVLSLMTMEDALFCVNEILTSTNRKPISIRRLRAIAKQRHDKFDIGYQIPHTRQWLFRPSEIDRLVPGMGGRPRQAE